ncbi:hypothetical protein [Glutamicibacter protophormiae]
MRPSFDSEGLWIKAKLFMNRAMDETPRSFDERAMWASLALELLGKAALATHSPILIADPKDDSSLLGASGLVSSEGNFKSVPAATIYRRCKRAFGPFDEKKAEIFAFARNDYLHGSGITFSSVPEERWWADFWGLASTLIDAQDKSIEDFVGDKRTYIVDGHLQNNNKYVAERAESLVGRAKTRYGEMTSGRLSTAQLGRWKAEFELRAGLRFSVSEECPACGKLGLLEAEDVENMRIETSGYSEDDYTVMGLADAAADYFVCGHCQLVLDGYELLVAAGIEPVFEVEDDDFIEQLSGEPDYGNE